MSANSWTKTAVFEGDLSKGTPEQLTEWTAISIHRFAGGRQDYAVLRRELKRADEQLENIRPDAHITTSEKAAYVAIWTVDDDGAKVAPLFWGQLLKVDLTIGPVDQETAIAMMVNHHFGVPIRGQSVWDVDNEKAVTVHLDPVFNPLVDGVIVPNMQRLLLAETSPGKLPTPYNLWIDPESTRTEEAIDQRGDVGDMVASADKVQYWYLRAAVKTVCEWLCTPTYLVRSPRNNPAQFQGYQRIAAPAGSATDDLFNVKIRRGSYLPDILDTLLPPFKYGWFVKLETSASNDQVIQPRIEIFPATGEPTDKFPAKSLRRQAAGEKYDAALTHVISARVTADLSHLANVIELYGSLRAREVTIDLFKGWDEDDDAEDTTKDGSYPNVWRKFVGNEGGDYNGLRTEIGEAIDLNDVFSGAEATGFNFTIPKRREIEEPLKWRSGAEELYRQPLYLEYSTDAGDTYQPVPEAWGWRRLPNEIGVMFTGESVPPALKAAGDDARLRLTGTIVGDRRIFSVAGRGNTSPLTDEIIQLIDVSDRYHDRQISDDATFGSQLVTLQSTGDEAENQTELDALAELIRDENEHAHIAVEALLWGIRTAYEIGDILEKIEGKELDLSTRAASAGTPRYPQIREVHLDLFQQTTRIVASS